MKKRILPIMTVMALGFTACGGPSLDDINVAEINDACGCADALKTVSDIILVEGEKHDMKKEKLMADPESKGVMDACEKKGEEVMKKCRDELKLQSSDLEKCPSMKEMEENAKKFRDLL